MKILGVVGSFSSPSMWLAMGLLLLSPGTAVAVDAEAKSPVLRDAPVRLDSRSQSIGERLVDVPLTGLDGSISKLSELTGAEGLVLAVQSIHCPVSKKFVPALKRLAADYRDRGFSVVVVNPMEHEPKAKIEEFRSRYELDLPYFTDADMKVARTLRLRTTTEVFVLDSALTLVYRGAFSDQYGVGYALDAPRIPYVRQAMDSVLQGVSAPVEATTAPGCDLDLGNGGDSYAGAAEVTYHNRISRIIQRNCQECHRPGENGPFELMSYADVKGNRAMIKRVVERGSMPPWFAKEGVSSFANDRRLGESEREDLLAWIDAGLPEGDAGDAPKPRQWVEGWQIGKPDKIIGVPLSIRVPAEGTVPYKYVRITNKIDRDLWIQSMEIRPSAPENVHHVLVFLEYPKDHPRAKDQPDYRGGQKGFFAGMVPGQTVTSYPPGYAKFIPKGATLQFQIHYTTNGVEARDKTKLALKFADKAPLHEVSTLGISNPRLRIPPHANNHKVEASYRFREEGRILGFMPHMHLRGKSFRYELVTPDGGREVLLDVPHYDFNWQFVYELQRPLTVPSGSKLLVTGWFDNSDKNPANPDPGATVRFGEQTWEEMLIGYVSWHPTGP